MITKNSLAKQRSIDFCVQPVGLLNDLKYDLWLHMNFDFDSKRSEVVVESWSLTDSTGTEVSLSKLNYYQVEFVAQAMLEELSEQTKTYYHELEMRHYEGVKLDRVDDF